MAAVPVMQMHWEASFEVSSFDTDVEVEVVAAVVVGLAVALVVMVASSSNSGEERSIDLWELHWSVNQVSILETVAAAAVVVAAVELLLFRQSRCLWAQVPDELDEY